MSHGYVLSVDGASRGNPGPAAYGVVVRDAEGAVVAELSERIGDATNNVAEYAGLICGLIECLSLGGREVTIHSDSELMIRQLEGAYKVKSANLQPYHTLATRLLAKFDRVRLVRVPRSQNTEADRLANAALSAHLGF
jgi:ribonuclease HI